MIEPTLALQDAIGARLVATPAVVELIAPESIVDGPSTPATFPSIIIGEAQTVDAELDFTRRFVRVFLDLAVWTGDESTVEAKTIVGAIHTAFKEPITLADFDLLDLHIANTRSLRDPGGFGRAIVSVEALVGSRA